VTLSLGERVRSLHTLVAQMNIDSAGNETKMFVRNMLAEIANRTAPAVSGEVPDHHQCAFARWYEGIGRESFGQVAAFHEVEGPLASLYLAARGIRAALRAGDHEEALRHGAELSRIEQELLARLEALSAAISPSES